MTLVFVAGAQLATAASATDCSNSGVQIVTGSMNCDTCYNSGVQVWGRAGGCHDFGPGACVLEWCTASGVANLASQ